MPKILALDTSTDACSVALHVAGEIREDFRIIPRQHTKQLLPMIQAMLDSAGLKVKDLDAIAFGRGPGSFAGIRIATGVAQGLAFSAELNVLPISTLAAIALAHHLQRGDQQVIAALDARMDEVYWATYRFENGLPVLIGDERVDAPANVCLPDASHWTGVGSGWRYWQNMSVEVKQLVTRIDGDSADATTENTTYPTAANILRLAIQDYQLGKSLSPELALPVYLRDNVAWKKKDQQ
ncbi:tRNA (adenosine(37)-N6)-threonylcarbamoyltransferase complex dimerization subunit type 1 TsaB [Neptunomonas qingdaonensis]|uniref:tRNA threonylcarbamoyladenosine biosynthesis protein TsaB n=1 Tax=Neptunomonas qingdaonensis TaxID=1045558 RepID=A0A1I2SH33_9GAMM|nr:tRNA (adenosine(37)-N6)-threonylcarbamoyltransferase complex dimerization subunit type 1 TsaB [Neptunomonas qingdaonensis]SFG49476.1 tRNA threonylcarbamoyladenosine biosynthesis protein TsaB [Neptunomonas qingdaonensis]